MSDYTNKRAIIKVLEDCHLDKELFEKDVFDSINALPTLDEKEIIRKAFERVVERLEERVQWYEVYGDCEGNSYRAYDHAIEIVKEECGISE